MSLFVDTSGFYALLVSSEPRHRDVERVFREAASKGRRMVTTSYVLVETSALLQNRIGLAPVKDLDSRILPLVDVMFVDDKLHRRGIERLTNIDRRQVSLVDAVSFEAMKAQELRDVLALDPHFADQGFRLLP